MQTIRAAVIGCGAISSQHFRALQGMESVRVMAVCDILEERTHSRAVEFGALAFTNWRDFLDMDIADVYHICTPHYLHAEMACALLQKGKYVLCEKPMATRMEDARAMIAADTGKRLGIVYQNRFNRASVLMREIVDSGELGELLGARGNVVWSRTAPYYTESGWRGSRTTEGGGVLINQAIHTIDLLQWLCGGAASVKGSVSNDSLQGVIDVEDSAHFRLRLRNGAIGVFYATVGYVQDAPVELTLDFEKGRLRLCGGELRLERDGFSKILCLPEEAKLGKKSYWGNGHAPLIEEYYRCVQAGEAFEIDGVQGSKALEILLGAYASSENGQEIACTM